MTDKEFQKLILKKLEVLDTLQGSVQNMDGRMMNLENSFQNIPADITEIRQSQARVEFAHGEKLSALFDGYQSITETLADHTARLQRIEDKIETHEIQIQALDSTKANKRKVK